jgi:hypothetical protein
MRGVLPGGAWLTTLSQVYRNFKLCYKCDIVVMTFSPLLFELHMYLSPWPLAVIIAHDAHRCQFHRTLLKSAAHARDVAQSRECFLLAARLEMLLMRVQPRSFFGENICRHSRFLARRTQSVGGKIIRAEK